MANGNYGAAEVCIEPVDAEIELLTYEWGVDVLADCRMIRCVRNDYSLSVDKIDSRRRHCKPVVQDGRTYYGDVLVVDSSSAMSADFTEACVADQKRFVKARRIMNAARMAVQLYTGAVVQTDPNVPMPKEILRSIYPLDVYYWGYDHTPDSETLHRGCIEVENSVQTDVEDFFALAKMLQFPIFKVAPASYYGFNRQTSMAANVSCGFNFQFNDGVTEFSKHALGLAIDINPVPNPYFVYDLAGEQYIFPPNAEMDENAKGALYNGHTLVKFMRSRGWVWGGDWSPNSGRTDYQRFEKYRNVYLPGIE